MRLPWEKLRAALTVSSVGDPSQFGERPAVCGLAGADADAEIERRQKQVTRHHEARRHLLRTLLVQGVRAVMHFVNRRDDRHSRWIKTVMHRRHVLPSCVSGNRYGVLLDFFRDCARSGRRGESVGPALADPDISGGCSTKPEG